MTGSAAIRTRGEVPGRVRIARSSPSCTFTWIDRAFLEAHDVRRWAGPRSLPLWLPLPDFAGFMTRDTSPARGAGLTARPLGGHRARHAQLVARQQGTDRRTDRGRGEGRARCVARGAIGLLGLGSTIISADHHIAVYSLCADKIARARNCCRKGAIALSYGKQNSCFAGETQEAQPMRPRDSRTGSNGSYPQISSKRAPTPRRGFALKCLIEITFLIDDCTFNSNKKRPSKWRYRGRIRSPRHASPRMARPDRTRSNFVPRPRCTRRATCFRCLRSPFRCPAP